MSRLEFRYSKSMLILIVAGFPILLTLSILLPYASYMLLRKEHLNAALRLDAVLVGVIGISFGWLVLSGLRGWRSFFAAYSLECTGLRVARPSSDTFLRWSDLGTVRYRKILGQIELHFTGYPHLVILNNVDMNLKRQSLNAALVMIQGACTTKIRRSLF